MTASVFGIVNEKKDITLTQLSNDMGVTFQQAKMALETAKDMIENNKTSRPIGSSFHRLL